MLVINEIKVFGIVLAVLLAVDLPMILYINSQRYTNLFKKINGANEVSTFNMVLYSVICYSILAYGIYYFGLKQNSYLNGLILGLVVFGVYDFTNLATIANYDLNTAIMDVGWGTILCLIVTIISTIIASTFVPNLPIKSVTEMVY